MEKIIDSNSPEKITFGQLIIKWAGSPCGKVIGCSPFYENIVLTKLTAPVGRCRRGPASVEESHRHNVKF